MTNSLSLKQCHLPGQSSFLFSKCFSRFPQSLKDQKDTFFIPAHGITIPQYPHLGRSCLSSTITSWFDSGGLAPQAARVRLIRARPRATPTNPHVKYKCVHFDFSGSHFPFWTVFKYKEKASRIWFTGLEKIWPKYLENKRLHCFEKWHCLSDSEFVIFSERFCKLFFS